MDKENVLVIADSARLRATLADLLTQDGYSVFELPSAIGATRSILRHEVKAVIVDVSDSGLSTEKLVETLRGTARLSSLVILLVSSAGQVELSRLEATSQADSVLGKRDLGSSLLPTLQRALSLRRLGRSLQLISAVTA